MNKGYYYTEKTIKKDDVLDEEYAKIAEHIDILPGFNVKLDWERYYPYGNVFKTIFMPTIWSAVIVIISNRYEYR